MLKGCACLDMSRDKHLKCPPSPRPLPQSVAAAARAAQQMISVLSRLPMQISVAAFCLAARNPVPVIKFA